MKTQVVNRTYLVLILATVLIAFSTQGTSYGQTITASTPQPLTEITLHGSVVTLTLSGGTYGQWIRRGTVTVSGIDGVTGGSFGVDRVSDTEVTVELTFSGDFDTDATLTLTVGAGAIAGYNGSALTATVPVTAVEESLVPSTEFPLTEATLHGSVVTLTLSGRKYASSILDIIRDALTVSGIDGATFERWDVDRISDTEVTVELTFDGTDFDTDAILTFTVGARGIVRYNGQALTAQVPVTAMQESLVASTEFPLTEATLHESIVTLTLGGGTYTGFRSHIGDALTVSGIDGVTIGTFGPAWFGVDRVSDTQITVELGFDSTDFDTDATLTFTVGAGAIAGYNGNALTAQVPVTAMQESLTASTESPLTEANLHESVVTLTLIGRNYEGSNSAIGDAVTVSGIDGVTLHTTQYRVLRRSGVTYERRVEVDRISDTEITIALKFEGDFDTDATLTFTVGAAGIARYGQALTAQVPVTAMQESLVASTDLPLTEATLHGSVVTLTLSGGTYEQRIRESTVSGIDGVAIRRRGVRRVSDTEVTVELTFDGDFDADATLTFTVGAGAIAGYNGEALTAQIPVTAVEQSDATVSISPSPVLVFATGEQLRLSLNIANGENIAGYQATLSFDPTALRYAESANGDYLPVDAFFGDPIVKSDWIGETPFGEPIWDRNVTLAATALDGASNGDGTLATLTFEVTDFKASALTLSQVYLIDSDGKLWEVTTEGGEVILPPETQDIVFGDINHDSAVNIQDLVIVHSRFGQTGYNSADVNGDRIVDIADLVLVAGAFDEEAGAPSAQPQALELLSGANVRQWLTQAQHLNLTDARVLRGILFLEQLLAALIPKETALLPNYPNPFNPETWIPYRLAEDAFVTLTIYNGSGRVVRTLDVGHRTAAFYESRSKAIHWDGRNEFGEQVASGVYFYHLSAGDYSATRKMLILK